MWTQTPLWPVGMTFNTGRDLLLSYSDKRLCLPSDNCSLRGRERSINQNELRYCRTSPGTLQHASTTPGQTHGHWLERNLTRQDPVILQRHTAPLLGDLQATPLNRADTGGGGDGSPLGDCQIKQHFKLNLKQSALRTYGIVTHTLLTYLRVRKGAGENLCDKKTDRTRKQERSLVSGLTN